MARPGDAGRTLRGKSVRTLDGDDFVAVVNQGLSETLDPDNRTRLELDERYIDDATAALLADDFGERRIEQILVNKKIRVASFRSQVLDAYDSTCAVTGLRIINGGGKAEAQAAHIWSVADGGPDVVPNGVALSATAHWLFDRHLITFDDNLCLLVSHNKVPSDLLKLFPPSGQKIRLPVDPRDHPRPDFVAKHRARFAGSDQVGSDRAPEPDDTADHLNFGPVDIIPAGIGRIIAADGDLAATGLERHALDHQRIVGAQDVDAVT